MPSGSDPTNMHRATSSGATPGRIDTTRWLLLGGIVGPALLVVGVLAAGLTWPGFDHRARNISDLGGIEAPHPLLLNGTLVVVGVAVLGLLGAWVTAGGIDADRFAAGVYQRLLLATALTWLAATATVAARSARAARTHR